MARSGFEADVMADLKRRKVRFDYEKLKLKYVVERTYLVDLQLDNGIIIEIKGWFKPADRSKMLKVKAQHPDLDIRMLFMRDNTLNKTSKTTYTQWCYKHGFPCAVGRIPNDWLKRKPRYSNASERKR